MISDAEFLKLRRVFLLEMARGIERKMVEVGIPAIFGLEVARSHGLMAGICVSVLFVAFIHRAQDIACSSK